MQPVPEKSPGRDPAALFIVAHSSFSRTGRRSAHHTASVCEIFAGSVSAEALRRRMPCSGGSTFSGGGRKPVVPSRQRIASAGPGNFPRKGGGMLWQDEKFTRGDRTVWHAVCCFAGTLAPQGIPFSGRPGNRHEGWRRRQASRCWVKADLQGRRNGKRSTSTAPSPVLTVTPRRDGAFQAGSCR